MNITIVGGGNVGTQLAVHGAAKGHRITVYTSKSEQFSKQICIVNAEGDILLEGELADATKDAKCAFSDADVIFVTVPSYCMKKTAEEMEPYVKQGSKICLVPGTGGGECAFLGCSRKGSIIFGLQRVPSVARLVQYGHSVCATGYRNELHAGALKSEYSGECSELVSELLDMPCVALPNYLNLTLTPSNPILHTTRLRTIFADYHEGMTYDRIPLFYEGWNDATSELLLKCDDEVQQICKTLKQFDLSYVKSLREHYESKDAKQLTKKIRSIQGFKGLKTPAVSVGDKFAPDLQSRYFTADFPYGLAILLQIAEFAGVNAPNMRETMDWYYNVAGERSGFRYSDYGIRDYDDFVSLYRGH